MQSNGCYIGTYDCFFCDLQMMPFALSSPTSAWEQRAKKWSTVQHWVHVLGSCFLLCELRNADFVGEVRGSSIHMVQTQRSTWWSFLPIPYIPLCSESIISTFLGRSLHSLAFLSRWRATAVFILCVHSTVHSQYILWMPEDSSMIWCGCRGSWRGAGGCVNDTLVFLQLLPGKFPG